VIKIIEKMKEAQCKFLKEQFYKEIKESSDDSSENSEMKEILQKEVEKGKIARSRYDSYRSMVLGEDNRK
jgi:hypothetical protein